MTKNSMTAGVPGVPNAAMMAGVSENVDESKNSLKIDTQSRFKSLTHMLTHVHYTMMHYFCYLLKY